MIPVINLLFDIDTKVNKLSNLNGQFIPNETKIDLINKAQIKLILKKVYPTQNPELGMDSFSKRYEDLQNLQVPSEEVSLTNSEDLLYSYNFSLPSLTYDMIVPTNVYVTATRGNCKDRLLDVIDIMKHNDVRMLLKSPHYKPSFEYQEILASISSDKMYLYTDNTFTLNKAYVSYLKYPRKVDIAGYIHLDGTASTTVDCELEAYLENELVDLVVEEIADATSNQELSQTSRFKTKENE